MARLLSDSTRSSIKRPLDGRGFDDLQGRPGALQDGLKTMLDCLGVGILLAADDLMPSDAQLVRLDRAGDLQGQFNHLGHRDEL